VESSSALDCSGLLRRVFRLGIVECRREGFRLPGRSGATPRVVGARPYSRRDCRHVGHGRWRSWESGGTIATAVAGVDPSGILRNLATDTLGNQQLVPATASQFEQVALKTTSGGLGPVRPSDGDQCQGRGVLGRHLFLHSGQRGYGWLYIVNTADSSVLALGYLLMPAASTPLCSMSRLPPSARGLCLRAPAGAVLEVQWHWAGRLTTAASGSPTHDPNGSDTALRWDGPECEPRGSRRWCWMIQPETYRSREMKVLRVARLDDPSRRDG
jgi:hypothetical protein